MEIGQNRSKSAQIRARMSYFLQTAMNDNINMSIEKIDEWIEGVSQCKLLSEADVKVICDKVEIE